jgi:hypothetical protein
MAKCLGMYNPTSKEIISLMNKQLILPWANKHKCKQDFGFLGSENINNPSETSTKLCSSCEECLLWLNIAKELLQYISPKQEIELPETHFNYLIEMQTSNNNKSQLSSYNYHHHASSFEPNKFSHFDFKKSDIHGDCNEITPTNEYNAEVGGVWVTSQGTYYFKLNSLHIHLQLYYSFLKHLNQIYDIDALYNLLICLKMLMLHGSCLETAAKDQKGFLTYCLEKFLIPK